MDPVATGFRGIRGQVLAVCVALDERDDVTHRHCDRVRALAVALGRACRLSKRELRALYIAAGFHDVGKIGIPDTVLKKPGKLDAEDWQVMQTHAVRSERIVAAAALPDSDTIAAAVRHHHERVDGSGYPDGLKAEAIPPLARIIAIADAYDAMANLRHYGRRKAHREIVTELQQYAGQQHDQFLVNKFTTLIERSRLRASDSV